MKIPVASHTMLSNFEAKYIPEPNSGCWLWTAGCSRSGYGYMKAGRTMRQAHVLSYEIHIGPVPAGKEVDHGCRVRCCVNPDHLEAVTHKENLHRSPTLAAMNAVKTACSSGHPYSAENTYVWTDGSRHCRACDRLRKAAKRAQ